MATDDFAEKGEHQSGEARSSGERMEARRSPLSRLTKLTAGTLVAFALCFVYIQVVMQQALIPPLAVFVVVSLVVAGVVARGWAPLLAAVWFALVFVMSVPIIIADLSNPAASHQFLVQVITTGIAVVGFVTGIAATVQNSRGRRRIDGEIR